LFQRLNAASVSINFAQDAVEDQAARGLFNRRENSVPD
jgi:hypothetical protein